MRHTLVRACWFSCMVLLNAPVLADQPRTISVSGEGKANAPPDMATVHTGVVTRAEAAADALKGNNEAMQKVMKVLKDHQIASKDIQTSNFNVNPEYKHDPRGQYEPEIVGYRVTNQVRVHVRNLPDLGKVLDALVQAGSNQVSGISFGIDDPTGVMNQARNRAMSDARSRAELYAHAAGVELGKVLSISEQAVHIPQPRMAQAFAMERAAAAVPVATGEEEIRTNIHVVYEVSDGE